jgi:hypothetical protein
VFTGVGFELNDISVYNLTVGSMGEYNGPVSGEVTYKVCSAELTLTATYLVL